MATLLLEGWGEEREGGTEVDILQPVDLLKHFLTSLSEL